MKTPQPVLPYSPDSFKVSHYLFHNKIRSHTFILNQKILRELKFWFALINCQLPINEAKSNIFLPIVKQKLLILERTEFCQMQSGLFCSLFNVFVVWLIVNQWNKKQHFSSHCQTATVDSWKNIILSNAARPFLFPF